MQAITFYLFAGATLLSALMVVGARNPVHSVFFLILAFFSAAGLFVLLEAEFLAMLLVVVYVGAVAVLFLFVVMMLDGPTPWRREKGAIWLSLQRLLPPLMSLIVYVGVLSVTLGIAGLAYKAYTRMPLSSLTLNFTNNGLELKDIKTLLFFVSVFAAGAYVASLAAGQTFGGILKKLSQEFPGRTFTIILLASATITGCITWVMSPAAENLATLSLQTIEALPSNTHQIGSVLYTKHFYTFQVAGLILLVAMIGAIVLTLRNRPGVKRQDIQTQLYRPKSECLDVRKVESRKGLS